jgi:hypothetical protein
VDRTVVPGANHRPGEFAFDPVLRDLAAQSDRATARMAAKYTEYPAAGLTLEGPAWPWRPTVLLLLTIAGAVALSWSAVCLVPLAIRKVSAFRRRMG